MYLFIYLPFIIDIMIERTNHILKTMTFLLILLTFLSLIKQRMILYFLPTMCLFTFETIFTTIFIIYYEFISFPIRTFLQLLPIEIRFPSVILPIVEILTSRSIMIKLIEWTEHCFEMEHIEVLVLIQTMNQWYFQFFN